MVWIDIEFGSDIVSLFNRYLRSFKGVTKALIRRAHHDARIAHTNPVPISLLVLDRPGSSQPNGSLFISAMFRLEHRHRLDATFETNIRLLAESTR
jgi:hypothetical protein